MDIDAYGLVSVWTSILKEHVQHVLGYLSSFVHYIYKKFDYVE